MAPSPRHDAPPPKQWPQHIIHLTRSRLSPSFPAQFRPLVVLPHTAYSAPSNVRIKRIDDPQHPAHGQLGLVSTKRIQAKSMILPYLGVIHARTEGVPSGHEMSDYDLSLLRARVSLPSPSAHDVGVQEDVLVDIGIDAATSGNLARHINDYRGVPGAARPNAEFRVVLPPPSKGTGTSVHPQAVAGMEVWSLSEIGKGEEILVSYGKGFWQARREGGEGG